VPVRSYIHDADYGRVGDFLVDIYRPDRVLRAWLQPRWEYMHFHTMSIGLPFDRIGIAEDGGRILGVVHFEHHPAFNYLQLRPGAEHVAGALLDWADGHLGGESRSFGRKVLGLYVNDFDANLEHLVAERGYSLSERFAEDQALLVLDSPLPELAIPGGYRLTSLADDNDLRKINRVLWRGFDHEGPAPEQEIEGRAMAQRAPNFRKDLTTVAVAPNGDYAAFAGMWVVPQNRVAYVEPVATDPSYRRLGLGSAVVLESIRRAAAAGAQVVWVGSGLEFYRSMGFTVQNQSRLWIKPLD